MSLPDKHTLRRMFQRRRAALDQREARSAAIAARVTTLPVYQFASAIHCYLPIRSEVDTRPLLTAALSQQKAVVVPVVEPGTGILLHSRLVSLAPEDWEPGHFGVFQPRPLLPVAPGTWDLVLVPLVAFDRSGYRLGYGKGYYDRLLVTGSVPTIGLAFALQEATVLPREAHDIPLDWIVTEDECITTATGRR